MAHQGQVITNPRTRQTMTFVELRPERLRIDSVHPQAPEGEPLHEHPNQKSSVRVTAGSLVFEVDGERRVLGTGDELTVPAGVRHRFWIESDQEARSVQLFEPALDIASRHPALAGAQGADRGAGPGGPDAWLQAAPRALAGAGRLRGQMSLSP